HAAEAGRPAGAPGRLRNPLTGGAGIECATATIFPTSTHQDSDAMLVKKAIFPVAGLGTRFLPATKAQPKEMLPVVDKPLIQYAVEEAYAAGVREMIFVTGRHKRPIEDHFDMTFELEVALEQAGKQELLDVVRQVKPDDMECIY